MSLCSNRSVCFGGSFDELATVGKGNHAGGLAVDSEPE